MASSDSQKKALNRAVSIIENFEKHVEERFRERQFYLNMYHSHDAKLKRKKWWQTKFAHPFPFFSIETKASFEYEGVVGTNNEGLWQIAPSPNLASVRQAEAATDLMKYQFDRSKFLKEFYYGSKSKNIMGDWFMEVFWDRQERQYQQRDEIRFGLDGQIARPTYFIEPGASDIAVIKNQPDVKTLYINSVWPDPKATCLEDARMVCIRKEIPFAKLKEGEEFGKYINVDMLKGTQVPHISSMYYDVQPHLPYVSDKNSLSRNSRANPIEEDDPIVEVMELWDLRTGEVESIGNRQVYLGRLKPYRNLNNPLVHIKNYGEMTKFFGQSDFRAIAAHWNLINQYQCLEGDNVLYHHRGYSVVTRDAGANVRNDVENLRPGSVIVANNQGAIQHTRPDLFSPLVLQSKQDLLNQGQQALGLNEVLQGATPSSNVRSSGQFAQLANFGAKILSQGIRSIESGLKDLGEKWLLLNYEKIDRDQLVPILGNREADFQIISPTDIPPFSDIRVKLSSDLEALKEQKLQQMLQAINLSQNVPGFNTAGAIKDWFELQGSFTDPERLFLLSDEQSAALTLQQFGIGNVPQEPGAAGAVTPPAPGQVAQGNANSGSATIPGV